MNDLESNLATMADDARLSATAEEVLMRGDRIRRGRQRRMAVGGVAIAAGAAAMAAVVFPTSGGLPTAAAAWGPEAVNMRGADLAAATRLCSESSADLGADNMPADLDPVAADQRGEYAALVFGWRDTLVDCVLRDDGGHFVPNSIGAQPWVDLPAGTSIASLGVTHWDGSPDDGVPDPIAGINGGSFLARVADDVSAVYLDVDGEVYQAEVEGGFATLWLPAGITERQATSTAVVRAFDDEGNELEASPMEDVAPYGGGAVPGDD